MSGRSRITMPHWRLSAALARPNPNWRGAPRPVSDAAHVVDEHDRDDEELEDSAGDNAVNIDEDGALSLYSEKDLGPEGVRRLCALPGIGELKCLELSYIDLAGENARLLAEGLQA